MDFKDGIDDECGFHVEKKGNSCTPQNIINKIARNSLQEIGGNDDQEASTDHSMQTLKNKYNCESEACILSNPDVVSILGSSVADNVKKKYLKPTGPRMTDEWLSNFNIDEVLEQVEKKYTDPKFLHIPFQMVDFATMNTELNQLDWKASYDDGYRTFGTVINTDTSEGNGEHWFSLFGDFRNDSKNFTIEYFNSSGELPMKEITVWMKQFKNKYDFEKPIHEVIATRIQYQFSETECGPYSIYYIMSRLNGVPYSWFQNHQVPDSEMYLFRQYLFRQD